MRVPRGRSLSEPSRHTFLMTLDESPLMPCLKVCGGAKAGALLGNQPALARRQGRWSARHGCIGRPSVRAGTAHEPRGAAQRSAPRTASTNLGRPPCAAAVKHTGPPSTGAARIRDQHNAQENSSVVTTEWMSSPLSEEELIELPECVSECPVRRAHCGASCDFPTLSRHRATVSRVRKPSPSFLIVNGGSPAERVRRRRRADSPKWGKRGGVQETSNSDGQGGRLGAPLFRVGMDVRDASTVCVFKPDCIAVSASSPNPRLPQHWSSGGNSQVR
jgi:hypothetical protein